MPATSIHPTATLFMAASPCAVRLWQALLIAATVGLSWLLMQAVHELGHVIHALASGGRVVAVVLDPFSISRTDVNPNPHPIWERWGGACWGTALPLALWWSVRSLSTTVGALARFFAGFCLVANGAYFAAGAAVPVGDTADLVRLGVPRWLLAIYGVPCVALGLYLWNGLGGHFGFGPARGRVDQSAALATAAALLAVAAALYAYTLFTGNR
jgi:hypothetical protein